MPTAGTWGFFDNWHLIEDYKKPSKRHELAAKLRSNIIRFAVVNFILSIFIFLWQIVYFLFNYGEVSRSLCSGFNFTGFHANIYSIIAFETRAWHVCTTMLVSLRSLVSETLQRAGSRIGRETAKSASSRFEIHERIFIPFRGCSRQVSNFVPRWRVLLLLRVVICRFLHAGICDSKLEPFLSC